MAIDRRSVEHRIITVQGQLGSLREMRGDADLSCSKVARLVATIDGSWSAIRRTVIREWLDQCLEAIPDEERDGLQDLVEALEGISGRP